ncbi:DUF6090 family protein [Yeosuana sp. MJ-SS3]|uniref:DUF6090 family protein n=1 Tax=Gilvirhabdus luticola TaxID=3079858 RepID=A0ABU3U5J8_9FLAO|nr:DUF6090 family protein [Yeosuana sp. MJ-SS3]MDU8885636.1 DUF6090 family protein [Yeosuana sp. MJ-SS3]
MINFFRKIRHTVLSEGKTIKYFKYAVGEIILVVVGILIALQINNWNENRKETNLELKYLQSIQKDLNNDIKYYDRRIKEAQNNIENYYRVVDGMYQTQKNFEEYARLFESFDFPAEHLTIQNFTFNELVSSGNIGIIKNKVLKDSIASLYKISEEKAKYIQEFNEFTANNILNIWGHPDLPFSWLYASRKNVLFNKKVMSHGLEWDFINDPNSLPFKLIRNNIGLYYVKLKDFIEKFENLRTKSIETVDMIQNELYKRT